MTKRPIDQNPQEITLRVPEGVDPAMASALFQHILGELHSLAPLHPPAIKQRIAEGLVGDSVPISKIRGMLHKAVRGTMWGIDVLEPSRVIGGEPTGIHLAACARFEDAQGLDEQIKTLTCYALLTSAPARGLAALMGIGLRIRPPQTAVVDDDVPEPDNVIQFPTRKTEPPTDDGESA